MGMSVHGVVVCGMVRPEPEPAVPPAHPRKGGEKLSGLMAPAGTAFTALNAGDNVPLQLVAVGAPAVILSATILAISLMVPGRRRRPSES